MTLDRENDMLRRVSLLPETDEVHLRLPRNLGREVAEVIRMAEGRASSDVDLLMRTLDRVLFEALPTTPIPTGLPTTPRLSQNAVQGGVLESDLNPKYVEVDEDTFDREIHGIWTQPEAIPTSEQVDTAAAPRKPEWDIERRPLPRRRPGWDNFG